MKTFIKNLLLQASLPLLLTSVAQAAIPLQHDKNQLI